MAARGHMPKPTKDCRVCNRRRIKCDRSLPTCMKCASRSLCCPGYGVTLKWSQGIASRGRLRGHSLPFLESSGPQQDISPTRSPYTSSPPLAWVSENEMVPACLSEITASSSDESDVVDILPSTLHQPNIDTSLTIPSSPSTSIFLQNPSQYRLLHHYNSLVASQLDWVDSLQNPWRNTILPLAAESSPLLFSVLAISAGDLAVRYSNCGTPNGILEAETFTKYRDRTLEFLAENLKFERQIAESKDVLDLINGPIQNISRTNLVLAAILMLCHLAFKQLEPKAWRMHLKAGQTLMRSLKHRNSGSLTPYKDRKRSSSNDTEVFIEREFFCALVYASWTEFSAESFYEELETGSKSNLISENAIFIEFLQIGYQITRAERQRHEHGRSLDITMFWLHAMLEQARERTLIFGSQLSFCSSAAQRDFARLVDVYYHAIRIYGSRIIIPPFPSSSHDTFEQQIIESRNAVLENLNSLSDLGTFAQDLVLPLFIAGTECTDDLERQEFVEAKLLEVMRLTGQCGRLEVLRFLKEYWGLPGDGVLQERPHWIDVLRTWADQGEQLLIL